jgi:hypothetical protein
MPQYQGIWTLQDAARLQSTQQWATDPLFDLTTLLLQADNAPNGAQNNTFIDSSSNNFTITRNGNTTQGSFTPFSATGWGNYFDGTGDNLSLASVTAVGNSNATVEFFIYPTDSSLTYRSVFDSRSSTNTDTGFGIFQYGAGIEVYGNGLKVVSTTGALNINQWNHVALTRSSGTCQVYVNGIASGSSATYSSNLTSTIAKIGDSVNTAFPYIGYISNLRVVIGSVLYSGATYTVPTASLTAITNTSLLTCQSNRFVDNSTNAFAITVNGNTSVQAFSPFAPQYQWTAPVIGGSGYFDGNDFLTYTYGPELAFGTGDFTVEFWMYPNSNVHQGLLQGDINAGWGLFILSGTLYWQSVVNQTNRLVSNVVTYLTPGWQHWALARSSGTLSLYIDGQLITSIADSTNYSDASGTFYIGQAPVLGIYANAYLSGLRIVKGTAVYTAAFTPPTAPPTAITNTSLLLNYTNAGIYDGTMKNNLETVGNAQVNTSIVKYGTGSMAFDGSGDYSYIPSSINFGYGTGDFTIEFWLYLNSTGLQTILSQLSSNPQVRPHIYYSGGVRLYVNGADVITGGAVTVSTWTHIALSKSATSTKLFINGTQSGSTYTDSNNYGTSSPLIIADYGVPATGTNMLNGYIDDLRITKGVARYTANFTPPTVALPRQ